MTRLTLSYLFTMSSNCCLLPDLDSSWYDTGWYLVHQGLPEMCSEGGEICLTKEEW